MSQIIGKNPEKTRKITYQIMMVSMNGWVGGATKKAPENAMKLRESRL